MLVLLSRMSFLSFLTTGDLKRASKASEFISKKKELTSKNKKKNLEFNLIQEFPNFYKTSYLPKLKHSHFQTKEDSLNLIPP